MKSGVQEPQIHSPQLTCDRTHYKNPKTLNPKTHKPCFRFPFVNECEVPYGSDFKKTERATRIVKLSNETEIDSTTSNVLC